MNKTGWVVYNIGFWTAKPEKLFDNYDDAYEYAREIRKHVTWGVGIKEVNASEVAVLTKGISL